MSVWEYVTRDLIKGGIEVGRSTLTGAAGTLGMLVGSAATGAGLLIDPLLVASKKVPLSMVEQLDTNNVIASEEEYAAWHDELAWPGWGEGELTRMGEELAMDSATTTAASAGGFVDAGYLLAPGGERDPNNRETIQAFGDSLYGDISTEAEVLGALFNPSKFGIAFDLGGVAISNSTDWLASRDAIDVNKDISQAEYDIILHREKNAALREAAQQRSIQSVQDQLNRDIDRQATAIDREQAIAYAKVLAGPQGFSQLDGDERGMTALMAALDGDYDTTLRIWREWESEGNTWVPGQNYA